jgi:hypothetical protein
MTQQEYTRICGNPNCRLVYTPDSRIYKEAEDFCPRCGFDQSKAGDWKGRQEAFNAS